MSRRGGRAERPRRRGRRRVRRLALLGGAVAAVLQYRSKQLAAHEASFPRNP